MTVELNIIISKLLCKIKIYSDLTFIEGKIRVLKTTEYNERFRQ